MNVDDFKKEMAKMKTNPEEEVKVDSEKVRETAMEAYLKDVAPISEYINKGFAKIDAKQLAKKEGNAGGR